MLHKPGTGEPHDATLSGLGAKLEWTYTRYAGDMTLSAEGDAADDAGRLHAGVRRAIEPLRTITSRTRGRGHGTRVSGAHFNESRFDFGADGDPQPAPGMEAAAGRGMDRTGNVTFKDDPLPSRFGIGCGDRTEEGFRVRMERI